VLHYSPIKGGLSYLPFGLTIGAGIGIGTALMPRIGVKPLLAFGFFTCAVGMLLTSGIDIHSTYLTGVMPGMVVLGFGSGCCFPATGNAALHEVTGQDSSLASGVQAAFQQVGGALGLSVLVTVGLRHAAGQLRHGVPSALAVTHGYVLSYRVGAGLLVIGGMLVLLLLEHVVATPRQAEAEVEVDAAVAAEPAVVDRPVTTSV
jgi:MFS family permease